MALSLDDIAVLKQHAAKNPRALLSLPPDQQLAAAQALVAHEDERYSKDCYTWAKEQVWTIDEASNQVLRFPQRDYLEDFFWALTNHQLIAVVKSRRMFITWAVAIYITWRIRYQKHVAAFIQSEIEDKAAYVIDKRMKFVEDNLTPVFRRKYDSVKTVKGLVGTITYPGTGSSAKALAQGADAFRVYTPSIVFMDEIEFQEKGHQSFTAALPFAEKNCQIILCSTSNGPHGVLADMARGAGFVRFQ